ncbi:hypothetical protein [Marinobacter salicampi]|uniref:hypothetical protein n=1 Tax=Marinobacter salicampi TaxID=435907 RepID=UPI00140A1994|nr:hypothetical protein [Marinobacter salicampi]
MAWDAATDLYNEQTSFPAEFRVEHLGATFVVKAEAETATMALVTMLPPKK